MSTSYDSEPDSVLINKTPEGITTITINREARRNAVDGPTGKKLTDAFLAFEDDPTQKVAVFHGAHGTFCAGFDLHEVAKFGQGGSGGSYGGPLVSPDHRVEGRNIGPIGPSRMQIKKPVISAVSGYAVRRWPRAVAAWANLRVARGRRRLRRLLAVGGASSTRTVRCKHSSPRSRLDMILTGRSRRRPKGPADGSREQGRAQGPGAGRRRRRFARQLLLFPQLCMNTDRASCYYAAYNASSFEDALSREFDEGIKVVTAESVSGAAKFSSGAGRHGAFERPEDGAKLA
ncbi:enoyl-CoA hydratase [Verticillium alfalfae VaMs.102]|uniref:Enoyl-CoA hydratase n=1 Tax=Verticillium alfalfae (strain VaMs.102 / ATCC MYA-4576 / FGSC 10136) TaxID=526221 RepID=C9STU7_VERA1|nr:enoyl-CoA hydratase [Verticillium alfalfae VaMs.102]EEY22258.1 enoyl-CoA hydratase [Verticillium alfalfae VaMs.102]